MLDTGLFETVLSQKRVVPSETIPVGSAWMSAAMLRCPAS
jgi:hypothetical protein